MKRTRINTIITVFLILCVFGCQAAFASAGQVTGGSKGAVKLVFPDVNGHWGKDTIEKFAGKGWLEGYVDGSYRPDSLVSRAEFTAMVIRIMNAANSSAECTYPDVNKNQWFYKEVSAASGKGYISGFPDGSFKPFSNMSRQEAAVFSQRLLADTVTSTEGEVSFNDEKEFPQWSAKSIKILASLGVIKGYPDGSFKPARLVTRAEAAKILDVVIEKIEEQKSPVPGALPTVSDLKAETHTPAATATPSDTPDQPSDRGNGGGHSRNTPSRTPAATMTTMAPTPLPTAESTQTLEPTEEPTVAPTQEPTLVPTEEPTEIPTPESTAVPTEVPTEIPTPEPTAAPTEVPTEIPTPEPTATPTEEPTATPTLLPGYLHGKVVDYESKSPLEGALIKAYNGQNLTASYKSSADGAYSLTLEPGDYEIVVSLEHYITTTIHTKVERGNTEYNPILKMIKEDNKGDGIAEGTIKDAFDNHPVGGLTIKFRSGVDTLEGQIAGECSTDANGKYKITLPGGYYTGEITGAGYIKAYFVIQSIGGETKSGQDGVVTAILLDGQIRVVLTWGAEPKDLDSHLTGPVTGGGKFHIFYSDKTHMENSLKYDDLDVDDVNSYGPETTTIYNKIPGKYTFYLHDYTNRSSSSSMAMANSGAVVKVYKGNEIIAVFNVPNDKDGTLWTVFEIDDNRLNPINKMSYESQPPRVGMTGNGYQGIYQQNYTGTPEDDKKY